MLRVCGIVLACWCRYGLIRIETDPDSPIKPNSPALDCTVAPPPEEVGQTYSDLQEDDGDSRPCTPARESTRARKASRSNSKSARRRMSTGSASATPSRRESTTEPDSHTPPRTPRPESPDEEIQKPPPPVVFRLVERAPNNIPVRYHPPAPDQSYRVYVEPHPDDLDKTVEYDMVSDIRFCWHSLART